MLLLFSLFWKRDSFNSFSNAIGEGIRDAFIEMGYRSRK